MKYSRNIRKCVSCGAFFLLTDSELTVFEHRGLSAPKRCLNCRKERRLQRKTELVKRKQQQETEAWSKRRIIEKTVFESALEGWNTVSIDAIVPNDDNVLYILGNGFDLMHGVRSSYFSFRDFLGKNNSLRKELEEYLLPENIWADFENALGQINTDMIAGAAVLDTLLEINGAYEKEVKASDYIMSVEQAIEPLADIAGSLQRFFRSWVETLTIGTEDRPLKAIFRDGKVLCFNYTEFVETMYGLPADHVCYIHGCRKRIRGRPVEHLVLGHRPGVSFQKREVEEATYTDTLNKRKAFLVESAQDNVMLYAQYYDEQLTKHCDSIIFEHRSFFDSLKAIDKVVVIGHSHSQVDWQYFAEVHTCIKQSEGNQWYFGCHSKRDLDNLEQMLAYLGVSKQSVRVFRTDEIQVTLSPKQSEFQPAAPKQKKPKRLCQSLDARWTVTKTDTTLALSDAEHAEASDLLVLSFPFHKAFFSPTGEYLFVIRRDLEQRILVFAFSDSEWSYQGELTSSERQGLLNNRLRKVVLGGEQLSFVYNNRLICFDLSNGKCLFNRKKQNAKDCEYPGEDITAFFNR